MSKDKKVFDELQRGIMQSNLDDQQKNRMLKNIMQLKEERINIMITGATGCGKSSTINALFNMNDATATER